LYIVLSAEQGFGGILLTWFGIVFSSVAIFIVVWGILRPDSTECSVDSDQILWHLPGPFGRDGTLKLQDIAEVHAGIGGGPGSTIEAPVPLEFVLRNGAQVKMPWVCYGNWPRTIIEVLAPQLPGVRFYIDGSLLSPSQIRPLAP
jgi:hypothetical protein